MIALYMNCVSAHVLPLAKRIAKRVGEENLVYITCDSKSESAQTITTDKYDFEIRRYADSQSLLESADVVYAGQRDVELFQRRAALGLKTLYGSERWFKPVFVGVRGWGLGISGAIRMLIPSYRRMIKRFVKWANTDPNARVLAIGPWAKKDFLRMGVKEEKIVGWGYYVAPSTEPRVSSVEYGVRNDGVLKVLWVGRMLGWKRVKDIKRAIELVNKRFKDQGSKIKVELTTLTGVTPAEVRKAMQEHYLYVLASDANEGWGAALNEALEEGMSAVGTFEAGASAAILPKERIYHAGDVKALAKLLEKECRGELPPCTIGEWTADNGSKRLLDLI